MKVDTLKLKIKTVVDNPKATKSQLIEALKAVEKDLDDLEPIIMEVEKPVVIKTPATKEKPGKIPKPRPVTSWY